MKMTFIGYDCIHSICSFLQPKELLQLRGTSRYFNSLCNNRSIELCNQLEHKYSFRIYDSYSMSLFFYLCRRISYVLQLGKYMNLFITDNALDILIRYNVEPKKLYEKIISVYGYLDSYNIHIRFLSRLGYSFCIDDIDSYNMEKHRIELNNILYSMDDISDYTKLTSRIKKYIKQSNNYYFEYRNLYDIPTNNLCINDPICAIDTRPEYEFVSTMIFNRILDEEGYDISLPVNNISFDTYDFNMELLKGHKKMGEIGYILLSSYCSRMNDIEYDEKYGHLYPNLDTKKKRRYKCIV